MQQGGQTLDNRDKPYWKTVGGPADLPQTLTARMALLPSREKRISQSGSLALTVNVLSAHLSQSMANGCAGDPHHPAVRLIHLENEENRPGNRERTNQ